MGKIIIPSVTDFKDTVEIDLSQLIIQKVSLKKPKGKLRSSNGSGLSVLDMSTI